MDTVLADLLKSISMEAIKIIGPATVAALVAYKTTRVQYELKLKEVEKNQEFSAKQALFDYYKNRQVKISESYDQLRSILGSAMGAAAAIEDNREEDDAAPRIVAVVDMINSYVALAPFDVSITERDYRAKNLDTTEEFQKLIEYKTRIKHLKKSTEFDIVRANVLILLELYSFLDHCNQALMEHQMQALFLNYIKNDAYK